MITKKEIYRQALQTIQEKRLFFLEDLFAFLPCPRARFCKYFPEGSRQHGVLMEQIEKNKIEVKTQLLNKWYESDRVSLQLALYKAICSEEELAKLGRKMVKPDVDATVEPGEASGTPILNINPFETSHDDETDHSTT